MNLIAQIENFIKEKEIIISNDRILVAVSGGLDSMVLMHVLQRLNYTCAIAHCNFSLRGKESDKDEELVKKMTSEINVKSHFKKFSTEEYAAENKLSIQEAARDLRYKWFNELCDKYGYTKVATAHHLDDNIETVLINLQRGTGAKGLRGILPKRNKIIRPLLQFTKDEIRKYSSKNKIEYRNDQSNLNTKYLRNKIRIEVIPALKKADPDFYLHWKNRITEANENWKHLEEEILKVRQECVHQMEGKTYIKIEKIIEMKEPSLYLFHLLDGFGFSVGQRIEASVLLDSPSGKKIIGKKNTLLKDRDYLIISSPRNHSIEMIIGANEREVSSPLHLELSEYKIEDLNLIKMPNFAFFDLEKIQFPLRINEWQAGDVFYPIGMNGKKKLSDLFIDEKVDDSRKKEIPIMRSGEEIIWVMGIRSSDKHKVSSQTKKVLKVEWKNASK